MHNFDDSLRFSHSVSDLPFWGDVYKSAFPGFLAMVDHRDDGEHQRAGIDRSVLLKNSKQILIDEKARRKDYGDILLEYMSDAERNAPGWVCKPIRADYIAYAVVPRGICYLLPVLQLQMAWQKHSEYWLRKHGSRKAENSRWTTLNCPVPVDELYPAIGGALRVRFAGCHHA